MDDLLDEVQPQLPALSIEGARGVGKTATAMQRARTIHRLDDPAQLAAAEGDPVRLLQGEGPTLIDEWQRLPEIWDLVRRAVDEGAKPGSFILTGSVRPSQSPTHSGAGRIVSLRMRPMTMVERKSLEPTVSLGALLNGGRPKIGGSTSLGLEWYVSQIACSGFPGLLDYSGKTLEMQLDGYIDRIVEHDFEAEAGREVRNESALLRWMRAYAASIATATSFEKIRDAATSGNADKPARSTVIPYRDALERLWILDPLPAWLPSRSRLSRLSAGPKHQMVDPALALRLLGLNSHSLLNLSQGSSGTVRDVSLLGRFFESLVAQSIRVYAELAGARLTHLRTAGGRHEVDLVCERPDGRIVAIEVKLKRTIADGDLRHLKWLGERIGDELLDAVVITSGPEAYRRPDGIAVVPAALLTA